MLEQNLPITPINDPTKDRNYKVVSLPMPQPEKINICLILYGEKVLGHFLEIKEQQKVGDIITVSINIDEKAALANTTKRSRSNAEDPDITNLLGQEGQFKNTSESLNLAPMISLGTESKHSGAGTVDRSES